MTLATYLTLTAGGPGSGRRPGALGPVTDARWKSNPYRGKLIESLLKNAKNAEAQMERVDPYSRKQLQKYVQGMRRQAASLSSENFGGGSWEDIMKQGSKA